MTANLVISFGFGQAEQLSQVPKTVKIAEIARTILQFYSQHSHCSNEEKNPPAVILKVKSVVLSAPKEQVWKYHDMEQV